MYIVLVILILCFRNLDISKRLKCLFILVSCIYCIVLPWGIVAEETPLAKPNWQVANGEYLHECFVDNTTTFNDLRTHVYDNDKNTYISRRHKGVVTIFIDREVPEGKILVPKLWYKGYRAYTASGEELECRMGYSQFVLVEVGDYQGEITVLFKQEFWLLILKGFSYGCILLGIINYIKDTFTKKKDMCYNKVNK
jgi:hypothetical protein